MTVREQVVSKLNILTDEQIKQVADFLDFLKFREKKTTENSERISQKDGIFNLGKSPVETGLSDASENLDKYIY
ncbi:hypothetical protein BH20ACI4_BH20ACI4_35160 [soil metagenome]